MLLVIDGAPGVGKSTLARHYADDHPLSLVLDIDMIRRHLGRWDEVPEARAVARQLAAALAQAHLRAGYDVIIPQFIGRPEFLEVLRQALIVSADSRPDVSYLRLRAALGPGA